MSHKWGRREIFIWSPGHVFLVWVEKNYWNKFLAMHHLGCLLIFLGCFWKWFCRKIWKDSFLRMRAHLSLKLTVISKVWVLGTQFEEVRTFNPLTWRSSYFSVSYYSKYILMTTLWCYLVQNLHRSYIYVSLTSTHVPQTLNLNYPNQNTS